MIRSIMPKRMNQTVPPAMLSCAVRASKRLRIPRREPTVRPVLVGNRNYLRALRAAEMAAWEAGIRLKFSE